VTRKNLNALRLCEASYKLGPSLSPDWAPFLRADRDELPNRFVLIIRSMIFGPVFFGTCILVLVVCGICALILPQHLLRVAVTYVCEALSFCCGLKIFQVGTPNHKVPCVVSNHNSGIDIVILLRSHYAFVAMEAVRAIPIVGSVASAIGCIFVARDDKDSRLATKQAIAKRLTNEFGKGKTATPQLVVFPEGSTTNGNYLLQFRRGAFEADVPVQPLRIEFEDHVLNYTIYSIGEVACLACSLPARRICLHWLPVIQPCGDADKMAHLARDAIANSKSAFNRANLIKVDSASHREGIATSKYFRSQ
jgi:1-acyl-sn-glycerol-3-phosphate acyltransferase